MGDAHSTGKRAVASEILQFLSVTPAQNADKEVPWDIIYGWSVIAGAAAIVSGDQGERKGENGEERMYVEEKNLDT